MRIRVKGIDEFSIARAFGAVALAVTLYGISLSAAALMESPVEVAEGRAKWFTPVVPANETRPGPANAAPRGKSFWQIGDAEKQSGVSGDAAGGALFWSRRDTDATTPALQVTGKFAVANGQL
jgi:hypothetical protein